MDKVLEHDDKVLNIDDMSVINEILKGRTLDIIIELMNNELTEKQLADRLDIYPMKLKYYLSLLEKFNIVECVKVDVIKQKINSIYKLKTENMNMLINFSDESKSKVELVTNLNKYNDILKVAIKSIAENPELPNKQGALFINTSLENVNEFKNELNKLINKFINMDNPLEESVYLFLPMLLPYDIKGEKNEKVIEE